MSKALEKISPNAFFPGAFACAFSKEGAGTPEAGSGRLEFESKKITLII